MEQMSNENLEMINERLKKNLLHKTVLIEVVAENIVSHFYIKNLMINFNIYEDEKKIVITDIYNNTGLNLAIKFKEIKLSFDLENNIKLELDNTVINTKIVKIKRQGKFKRIIKILKEK